MSARSHSVCDRSERCEHLKAQNLLCNRLCCGGWHHILRAAALQRHDSLCMTRGDCRAAHAVLLVVDGHHICEAVPNSALEPLRILQCNRTVHGCHVMCWSRGLSALWQVFLNPAYSQQRKHAGIEPAGHTCSLVQSYNKYERAGRLTSRSRALPWTDRTMFMMNR